MVSIVIPSRQEVFLNKTIQDVLDKSRGEIEVFPVLDGYDCERIDDKRVKYITIPNNGRMQKRQGVNAAASIANGKYIMCVDAHCMFDEGFDEVLKKDCDDNWIVVPRRKRLDPINWCVLDKDTDLPIDYSYWMWKHYIGKGKGFNELLDYKWNERTAERMDIKIDDILTHQGSCWFMTKKWFDTIKFEVKGYTGWGQESEELCLKTWTQGGSVKVNKNTWYAHLFKGKEFGRMYFMSKKQRDESIKYSFNYWCRKHKDKFAKVINKFMPIPNWPLNWEEYQFLH